MSLPHSHVQWCAGTRHARSTLGSTWTPSTTVKMQRVSDGLDGCCKSRNKPKRNAASLPLISPQRWERKIRSRRKIKGLGRSPIATITCGNVLGLHMPGKGGGHVFATRSTPGWRFQSRKYATDLVHRRNTRDERSPTES